MSQQLHFWTKIVLVFLKNLPARLSSANINGVGVDLKRATITPPLHDKGCPQVLSIFNESLLN